MHALLKHLDINDATFLMMAILIGWFLPVQVWIFLAGILCGLALTIFTIVHFGKPEFNETSLLRETVSTLTDFIEKHHHDLTVSLAMQGMAVNDRTNQLFAEAISLGRQISNVEPSKPEIELPEFSRQRPAAQRMWPFTEDGKVQP